MTIADEGERMRFAYNTNGMAHHRLPDALTFLADTGYDGVALTVDVHHLDPTAATTREQAVEVARLCTHRGLGVVVETGARFLLDPRRKHHPTLVSSDAEDRARRLAFLRECCELATLLNAEAVSFWAGVGGPDAWEWLREGVSALVASHGGRGFALSLEPEPGMVVGDCAAWERLEIPSLSLALDTGHCLVEGDLSPQDAVRRYGSHLGTVAVEGMRRGVHEHLPVDEGDLDLPAVLSALVDVGWTGLVTVEQSRDSHRADVLVPHTLEVLRRSAARKSETP